MSSPGFKIGQVLGIIAGVIIGSVAVSLLIGPKQQQFPQENNSQTFQGMNNQYVQPIQPLGVFEQALSLPATQSPP
jgi:gas vesicle protein